MSRSLIRAKSATEGNNVLLHSSGFAALLDEAREAYDLVIVDTPRS